MTKSTKKQAASLLNNIEDQARQAVDAIQTRGRETADRVQTAGRNVWLAGLGVVAGASERASDTIDQLSEHGKTAGQARLQSLTAPVRAAGNQVQALGHKVEQQVEGQVIRTLERMGVPSRREITSLINHVETLNQKIDHLASKA